MPRGILMLAIGCIVLASPAEGGTMWIGAQMHFPVPARDIGSAQLGASAGVNVTYMGNAYIGVGADLVYHYWPASPGYVAAFDRYLRTERMEALLGSDWALSAQQLTGHVRLAMPAAGRCMPWMQIGAGLYRLNYNLDERWPAGTYAQVLGPTLSKSRNVSGGYGAVGLDVHTSPRMVLGVDAAFHYVASYQKSTWGWTGITDLQDFAALTAGVHAKFGLR